MLSGGIVNNELSSGMWQFSCKDKRWTRGKPLAEARAKHSSVVMDGVLYLSGGVHMDDTQTVVPMTDIHSYNIKTGVWKCVGQSSTAKLESTLLGSNDFLYELGGQSSGAYTNAMEIYKVANDGLVTHTGEHFALPCTGQPGPLRAVSNDDDLIFILWESTGHLYSLNTDGRRFYPVNHSHSSLSGCLVVIENHAYILGGTLADGKPCPKGTVLDLSTCSFHNVPLPQDLAVHKCVHVRM